VAVAAQAQTALLYDTSGGSSDYPIDIGGQNEFAMGFMDTMGGDFNLTSVELELGPGSSSSGGLTISLYGDSATDGSFNGPGVYLGMLAGSSNPVNQGFYTFTGNIPLQYGSVYWVVAASSMGDYTCMGAFDDNNYDTVPWGSGSPSMSTDGGATWVSAGFNGKLQVGVTDASVESVPEPSTMALLALAGAGLLTLRRRKQRLGVCCPKWPNS